MFKASGYTNINTLPQLANRYHIFEYVVNLI